MSDKSPIERHRDSAQRIIETQDRPWHGRQTRLHILVMTYGVDDVSSATGFSKKTIQVYLGYKPYDLPDHSNAINESRLLKAEKELQQ